MLIFFNSISSFSQDIIITASNDTLTGKIATSSSKTITFTSSNNTTVINFKKKNIAKIIYQTGASENPNIDHSEVLAPISKNKIEFVASEVFAGRISFAYDRALSKKIEFRTPLSVQLLHQTMDIRIVDIKISSNIASQIYYHPMGMNKKLDYAIGISVQSGYAYQSYFSNKYIFYKSEFINFLRVKINARYSFQVTTGIGLLTNEYNITPRSRGSFQFSTLYKF